MKGMNDHLRNCLCLGITVSSLSAPIAVAAQTLRLPKAPIKVVSKKAQTGAKTLSEWQLAHGVVRKSGVVVKSASVLSSSSATKAAKLSASSATSAASTLPAASSTTKVGTGITSAASAQQTASNISSLENNVWGERKQLTEYEKRGVEATPEGRNAVFSLDKAQKDLTIHQEKLARAQQELASSAGIKKNVPLQHYVTGLQARVASDQQQVAMWTQRVAVLRAQATAQTAALRTDLISKDAQLSALKKR